MQQSGGQIAVDSEPGAGASFRLHLRVSEEELAEAEPVRPSAAPAPACGRLLVVEDDPQVLAVTVEVLRELGYDVVTAGDAKSALELLEAGVEADLLFSDVVMPGGCNGVELAKRARALRPDLKVLLSSGYVGQAVSLAADAFELIDKPYERSTLAERLAALLTGSGGSNGGGGSSDGRGRKRTPSGSRARTVQLSSSNEPAREARAS